jgi:hypothetical protein
VKHSRFPLAQRRLRRIDNFTLYHPAANGPHNRTVLSDQHLSGVSGGGAPAFNNLREGKGAVLFFKPCCFCENIHTNLKGNFFYGFGDCLRYCPASQFESSPSVENTVAATDYGYAIFILPRRFLSRIVNQVIFLALATLKLGYRADYSVNRRAKFPPPAVNAAGRPG